MSRLNLMTCARSPARALLALTVILASGCATAPAACPPLPEPPPALRKAVPNSQRVQQIRDLIKSPQPAQPQPKSQTTAPTP